jgi:phage/plasmid-like protein (TIGR03299 family)|tara:strand:- start:1467 stop:2399 length:933 start_codon:yes stop_codon:yes gene_type:complete
MSVIFDNLGSPWAGIGKKVDSAVSVADAMEKAGLDWTVSKEPMFLADGREVTQKAVVRSDNKSVLGYVTPKWTPYQNADAFSWFEPFVEANEVSFSTAGAFKQGRITWILAKLNRDNSEIAAGDEVEKYLLLSNSHDGKLAVRVGFTPIRIVCTNTLHTAHRSSASRLLRVNHGSNVRQNVNDIREIISMANQDFEATAAQYRYLASRQIKKSDLEQYVKIVLGRGDVDNEDLSTRTKNQIDLITKLFDEGQGNKNPAIAGSWWAAYNGVTEYLSYEKGNNNDNRMSSLWFGTGAVTNKLAFEKAVEMAA